MLLATLASGVGICHGMPSIAHSSSIMWRLCLWICGNFTQCKCNRWKKLEITFFLDRGSNPVRWTQSPTLYRVAIKAGLYRKAVQVYHIPIPCDILPLQIEIRPWISWESENHVKWYSRSFMHTCGLFRLGAKCNRWTNSYAATGDRTQSARL